MMNKKEIRCFNVGCFAYNICTKTMEENSPACEGFKNMYKKNPEKAIKVQQASYDELADMLYEKLKSENII